MQQNRNIEKRRLNRFNLDNKKQELLKSAKFFNWLWTWFPYVYVTISLFIIQVVTLLLILKILYICFPEIPEAENFFTNDSLIQMYIANPSLRFFVTNGIWVMGREFIEGDQGALPANILTHAYRAIKISQIICINYIIYFSIYLYAFRQKTYLERFYIKYSKYILYINNFYWAYIIFYIFKDFFFWVSYWLEHRNILELDKVAESEFYSFEILYVVSEVAVLGLYAHYLILPYVVIMTLIQLDWYYQVVCGNMIFITLLAVGLFILVILTKCYILWEKIEQKYF